ncbi:ABC transporter permease [Roseibacillus ishigakijimensis]|uniref:ABC transporter permease n=1 Tax=Roseibacillus ishigakijimensis TaxID=454146 RepID=A0A934RU73_9BACT|nr:ABC transporter permease [Roseibacillus ishigakijimensis]MBK1835104.1 ABC transporter permease [Roseibacillus ishigakijimensis]
MLKTILSRLTQTVVVVFLLVTFTFFAVRAIPGNPFASEKATSPEEQAALEAYYGLDKPLPVQYLRYWGNILTRGDFGDSLSMKGRKVSEMIAQSFPVSVLLGTVSLLLGICAGVPLGIIAALNHNKSLDYLAMFLAMAGICVVAFVLGPIFQINLAKPLDWLNVAGWSRPSDIILPAITLSTGIAAYLARLTRGGMLDVLSQDYIRTARAKGVPALQIILKHALRPALMPAVTFLGPAFAAIITGSFVVENIFLVPGMGQHFVTGITAKDYNLVLALVLFYGILMGIANLLSDLALIFMDPKLRSA